jgi:hypothetical protein
MGAVHSHQASHLGGTHCYPGTTAHQSEFTLRWRPAGGHLEIDADRADVGDDDGELVATS